MLRFVNNYFSSIDRKYLGPSDDFMLADTEMLHKCLTTDNVTVDECTRRPFY